MTSTALNHKVIKEAIRIRAVEEKFLELFSQGKLNGTVHTCVGQEFSALAFAGQLKKKDFIFSNHRCHGHYIAFTGDVRGLLAELLGKASGTSGGIGSSQHLCRDNFYSNGIQGGIVPVAAGYALGNKLKKNGAIGIVFIGDGTLGEGALYETMNIISKWNIPLLIVCENNFYAQSTPQSVNLAGEILLRPQAFGIETFKGDTWEPESLMNQASDAINYVRTAQKPAFFLVETYRLNAHSKGDDDRMADEVSEYAAKDFINRFRSNEPAYYTNYHDRIQDEINQMLAQIFAEHETSIGEYYTPEAETTISEWIPTEAINKRQVELLNTFFKEKISNDDHFIFLGEDVLSPYGGAFKIAKDLSFIKPGQVFSTPISEAAITGISNGLALNGFRPYVEIMFGDFITLAFDQIVNHASKFHHMFNKQVDCPVVIRTPMGGHRGYGPTHSQSLEKFVTGLDHVKTVALNTLIDPAILYASIYKETQPVVVIENKVDYGKKILAHPSPHFIYERSNTPYPVIRIRPAISQPTLTIVAYGGTADLVAGLLEDIFVETDLKPELFVVSLISSLPLQLVSKAVQGSGRLLFVEEGTPFAGIGSEMVACVTEELQGQPFKVKRVSALPVPIPSVKSLESMVLPDKKRIIETIKNYLT